MFPHRFLSLTINLRNKYLLSDLPKRISTVGIGQNRCYCGISAFGTTFERQSHHRTFKRFYSKDIDVVFKNLYKDGGEKDLEIIKKLFPNPRVTLNELSSRCPQKIFDVHYKHLVAPKGGRKKNVVAANDWICTYTFVWPETVNFESSSTSKKQAAEKAAFQAVQWLYKNDRIDRKGNPINRERVDEIKSALHQPLLAELSDNSVERISRIWDQYLEDIKPVYNRVQEDVSMMGCTPVLLDKESTVDQQDEYLDKENEEFAESENISETKSFVHPVYGCTLTPPSKQTLERRRRSLENMFLRYERNKIALPIDEYTNKITATLDESRVTVIVGAPGCGKSTRVPAAILKHCGDKMAAVVTEPRKVAAIGLAERVAEEMGEEVGQTVGFQVRLRSKLPRPPAGSILYCTSGVLLRRLQGNPGLIGCTHVFIDEAHERDVNTDVTLLLLKRALTLNPDLKLVIMSATIDAGVFSSYFDSCPVIEVPGRTFPIEPSYLEDIIRTYNLDLAQTMKCCTEESGHNFVICPEVVELIKAVDKNEKEGAILVFLPGWAEIKYCKTLLDEQLGGYNRHLVLPIHSKLTTEDQQKIFNKPLPGIRKIVLATNIAETSITIPDMVYVIDTGRLKENNIKEGTGMVSMDTVWVSKAGAKQRMGRAGRVQPGKCYKMYTKEKESQFKDFTTPEILRIPLEQTVLDCKTYAPHEKVQSFLAELPQPPSRNAVNLAIEDLIDLGALSKSEYLTPLGAKLASLTIHPRLGTCMINSTVLCNMVSVVNVCTSLATDTRYHVQTADKQTIREFKTKYSKTSDHYALHCIQDEFEKLIHERNPNKTTEFIEKNELRKDTLYMVRALSQLHLEQLIKTMHIKSNMEAEQLNRFSCSEELSTATLLSGCNKLLIAKNQIKNKGKLGVVTSIYSTSGEKAHIRSGSLFSSKVPPNSLFSYFGGFRCSLRKAQLVSDVSQVDPLTVLLFTPGDVFEVKNDENTSILRLPRHKLEVTVQKSQAEVILKAREMLWSTFQYNYAKGAFPLDDNIAESVARFSIRLVKALGKAIVKESDKNVQ